MLSAARKVNWTKTELFRLTLAEQITESKVRTQRNAQQKFLQGDWLSPNQKRHFAFWIKFGLSLKYCLSQRLIQKVKSPSVTCWLAWKAGPCTCFTAVSI